MAKYADTLRNAIKMRSDCNKFKKINTLQCLEKDKSLKSFRKTNFLGKVSKQKLPEPEGM